jgi:hypothetical protein
MNSAAGIIQVLAAGKCLGCLISVVFVIDVYVGAAAILKQNQFTQSSWIYKKKTTNK